MLPAICHTVPRRNNARRAYDRVETEPGLHTFKDNPAGEQKLQTLCRQCASLLLLV